MEEIKNKGTIIATENQNLIEETKIELVPEEKEELTEKQKRYNEIQLKKANKKRLTVEEKIFLKEMELTDLRIMLQEQQKKERMVWIKAICKMLKPELEKIYNKDVQDLDMKITSLLINSLENFEELSKNIDIEEYFTRNKSNKMVRIKKEIQG